MKNQNNIKVQAFSMNIENLLLVVRTEQQERWKQHFCEVFNRGVP